MRSGNCWSPADAVLPRRRQSQEHQRHARPRRGRRGAQGQCGPGLPLPALLGHRGSIGGDEFGVLIEDAVHLGGSVVLAEQLLHACREPIPVGPSMLWTTLSIGITFDVPGATVEQLLQNADRAMYTAKKNGKDRYEIIDGRDPLDQDAPPPDDRRGTAATPPGPAERGAWVADDLSGLRPASAHRARAESAPDWNIAWPIHGLKRRWQSTAPLAHSRPARLGHRHPGHDRAGRAAAAQCGLVLGRGRQHRGFAQQRPPEGEEPAGQPGGDVLRARSDQAKSPSRRIRCGDAEIAEDPGYAFADRVGPKYGADLRAYDGPGQSRVVVTVRPVRVNAVDMAHGH